MRLNIIKRRASGRAKIGREAIEIPTPDTLRDLLMKVSEWEYGRTAGNTRPRALTQAEARVQAETGRIAFSQGSLGEKTKFEEAAAVMIRDFEDGLFRVFINGDECTQLEAALSLKEDDEVTFIRLVMLAGRLW